jgi:type II secretory ATPase GspE/PulE/Tfp pilus assembly ATPase PilB-like protein
MRQMANSKIDAVLATIRAQREASRLCSEMAADTADNETARAEFASEGEQIDSGYESALESIDEGHWAEALDVLEGVRNLEKAGGDDQHARKSIEALKAVLSDSTAT